MGRYLSLAKLLAPIAGNFGCPCCNWIMQWDHEGWQADEQNTMSCPNERCDLYREKFLIPTVKLVRAPKESP